MPWALGRSAAGLEPLAGYAGWFPVVGGVFHGFAVRRARLLSKRDCLVRSSPQEPLVNVYPVSPDAASSVADGGVMVAVRLADLVTPLRNGRLPGGDCRSALVTGGCRRRAARCITRRWGRWRSGWRSRPGRA